MSAMVISLRVEHFRSAKVHHMNFVPDERKSEGKPKNSYGMLKWGVSCSAWCLTNWEAIS